jgi:hypothetical protein
MKITINFYKSNVVALLIYVANSIHSFIQTPNRNYGILVIALIIEFTLFYYFLF